MQFGEMFKHFEGPGLNNKTKQTFRYTYTYGFGIITILVQKNVEDDSFLCPLL